MHNCDNCGASFDPSQEGIISTARERVVAGICDDCCGGARTIKLVLKRRDLGGFSYEQFAALEMQKAVG